MPPCLKKNILLTTPSKNLWAIEPIFDMCEMAALAIFRHFTRYWFMLDPPETQVNVSRPPIKRILRNSVFNRGYSSMKLLLYLSSIFFFD